MRLYHFTRAWSAIEASGVIEPRWPESLGGAYAVRFVHLTAGGSIDSLPAALRGNCQRIEVELPTAEVVEWMPWVRANDPEGAWSLSDKLRRVRGALVRDGDDSQWYVVGRPVSRDEWRAVTDVATGAVLWTP